MSTNGASTFPNRGPPVFIVTTISLVLASIFIFARLLSRLFIVRRVILEDFLIFVGWAIAFVLSFLIDFSTHRGLGRHDVAILDKWKPSLQKCEYAFAVLYNPALMCTKSSILVFYLHLARNTNKLLRVASYITLALVNVAGIVLTLMNVFQCNPVGAPFDTTKTDAKCIPLVTLFLCSAPINIFTDIAILVLPIPLLTRMRLPRKQKNILVITFALGIFVVAVDLIRIDFLQSAARIALDGTITVSTSASQIGNAPDFAWYASFSLMWSSVEVNVGIICACIPTLKPLLIRILPSFSDGNRQSASGDRHGSDVSGRDQDFGADQQGVDPICEITRPAAAHQRRGSLEITRCGEAEQVDEDPEMGMFDFLTVPMTEDDLLRSHTSVTLAATKSVYFGFINMRRPKSMLGTRGWESAKYCMLVTSLFFLWGFSYGILNTLNTEVVLIKHGNMPRVYGLETAYFGAYFFGPLTLGQYLLRNAGFKITFITGLCIYGTGTLMFWPSAVLISYPGFVISNFVVGFGLSLLETAANPFISLCGPSGYREMRLLIAQGVQGVASVLSPLLANKVLFRNVTKAPPNLDKVQWTYLAIAFFDVILALFFYYMPLPEAADEALEMEILRTSPFTFSPHVDPKSRSNRENYIGRIRITHFTLALGAFSLFLYVGSQESMSMILGAFLQQGSATFQKLSLEPLSYTLLAHTAFAMGRFIFALLCLWVRPRILLGVCFVGVVIFSSLAFAIDTTSEDGTTGFFIACYLFEGPIFPLIFAISLRDQGRRTKWAAAILTSAVCGGGTLTWIVYIVYVIRNSSLRYIVCVPLAFFAAGAVYPLYLNFFPGARKHVDARPVKEWGGQNAEDEARLEEKVTAFRRMSSKVVCTLSKLSVHTRTSADTSVEIKDSRGNSVGNESTVASSS